MPEQANPQRRRQPTARRRALALQIRREGGSYDMIASRLGTTRQSAQRMVTRQLQSLAQEDAVATRRQLHVEALKELWRTLSASAVQGDLEAIDRFLAVEQRIAELIGLAPQSDWVDGEEIASNGRPAESRDRKLLEPRSFDTLGNGHPADEVRRTP